MGRPRKVVEGDTEMDIDIPSLKEYVAQMEEKAQPLTVCQITHPDAKDGDVYVGVYSGIRMVKGDDPSALISNGSTI